MEDKIVYIHGGMSNEPKELLTTWHVGNVDSEIDSDIEAGTNAIGGIIAERLEGVFGGTPFQAPGELREWTSAEFCTPKDILTLLSPFLLDMPSYLFGVDLSSQDSSSLVFEEQNDMSWMKTLLNPDLIQWPGKLVLKIPDTLTFGTGWVPSGRPIQIHRKKRINKKWLKQFGLWNRRYADWRPAGKRCEALHNNKT